MRSFYESLQVTIIVKKTTTTVGAKGTVSRRITRVSVPVHPNHAVRSVFINNRPLPLLIEETLKRHFQPISPGPFIWFPVRP